MLIQLPHMVPGTLSEVQIFRRLHLFLSLGFVTKKDSTSVFVPGTDYFILMGIGRDVFMQNEFWLKVIFIVLSTEILMTLVGAMTQIKKSVKFITLIKTGFIHFHLHWLNYLLCGVLSVGFLMVAKTVKPIMFSATLYMLQVVLELMSRKVEGDIPINFLNVFEKTI